MFDQPVDENGETGADRLTKEFAAAVDAHINASTNPEAQFVAAAEALSAAINTLAMCVLMFPDVTTVLHDSVTRLRQVTIQTIRDHPEAFGKAQKPV